MNFKTGCVLLLLAGSFFLSASGSGRVARDVEIEGIAVGGMRYAEAAECVREHIRNDPPVLVIRTPDGKRQLPADSFDFSDDLPSVLRAARAGERLTARVHWEWINAEEELFRLCTEYARDSIDASMKFSERGFVYTEGKNGLFCCYQALLHDALAAIERGGGEIVLSAVEYAPHTDERKLREDTELLARCSTQFDAANLPRSHNIVLAAERISGRILFPNQEFSFNRAVGERTEENGFEKAPVIADGNFVPGVGGGVCQMSTTLFGAALRAGLSVVESHPHSLSVGYAAPSLDAMVSSDNDLRFSNPFDSAVYLLARAEDGEVIAEFYGKKNGMHYETESIVISRTSPPSPLYVEGQKGIIRSEREGIASESYRLVYDRSGKLISRSRIRKDEYAAVQGIYGKD